MKDLFIEAFDGNVSITKRDSSEDEFIIHTSNGYEGCAVAIEKEDLKYLYNHLHKYFSGDN